MTMNLTARLAIAWSLLSAAGADTPSVARADGGFVRLSERVGGYQITAFTSPTPLRAGPVDISVLIQDAATGEWAAGARVAVRVTAPENGAFIESPATAEVATNKLMRAAVFELPNSGRWRVEIAVDGAHGPASVHFEMDAAEATPRWLDLWPWFTWPALAVGLFSVHQALVRRRK
jgi:hypothetical protein